MRAMNDSLQGYDLEQARTRIDMQIENLRRIAPVEMAHAAKSPADRGHDLDAPVSAGRARDRVRAARRGARARAAHHDARQQRHGARRRHDRDLRHRARRRGERWRCLVSIALWRTVSKPVQDLEAGMEAVAAGQFDYRAVGLARRATTSSAGSRRATNRWPRSSRSSIELKAEFVSVASHELKTPINVILGYLQLLNEGVYGSISAKQGEILRTVDAQTRSLSRLVHQLLDISRFEAGGGKLDLRPTELGHFLERSREHLPGARRCSAASISASCAPGRCRPKWCGIRTASTRCSGNLLSNAFKFTRKGGTVELDVQADGGQIRVTVSDTGAGIPPEQLPHIFQKFFQADNQHSAAHDGTGLGLAIAKQIVDAHGGKLTVESRVGEGTTFSITLAGAHGPRPRSRSASTTVPWTPAREDSDDLLAGCVRRWRSDARIRRGTPAPDRHRRGARRSTRRSASPRTRSTRLPTRCWRRSRSAASGHARGERGDVLARRLPVSTPQHTDSSVHGAAQRIRRVSRDRARPTHRAEAIALQRTTHVIDSLTKARTLRQPAGGAPRRLR